jgi:hypothetical protein
VVTGGVTVAGKKPHVAPAGNPEQANETAESNPLVVVTKTVVLPLDPPVTVREEGDAAMEKFGGAAVTASPTGVVSVTLPLVPLTVNV